MKLSIPLLLLFSAAALIAGGPKTPIVAQTANGALSGAASVQLCAASSPFPCATQIYTCQTVSIPAPDTLVKTSCGPAGFKITHIQYNITVNPTGGCAGVAQSGDTITCTPAGGTATVILKVGH